MYIPDMGFSLSWSFYNEADQRYEGYPENAAAISSVLEDMSVIFSIAARHELFFPESIRNDTGEQIALEAGTQAAVIEQIRKMMEQGEITYEIEQIRGYGLIELPGGEKVRTDNLIGIGPVRLFERQINIYTTKNIWVPINIDKTYQFNWQVELARLNGIRLEKCLEEIHQALGTMVSPQPGEVDQDNPVWQAGFRLFVNPEILVREYESSPPPGLQNLGEFLFKN